jgi:hypothetical protein
MVGKQYLLKEFKHLSCPRGEILRAQETKRLKGYRMVQTFRSENLECSRLFFATVCA